MTTVTTIERFTRRIPIFALLLALALTGTWTADAVACSVTGPYTPTTIVDEDVPGCIELATWQLSAALQLENTCDATFTLKVTTCAGCTIDELEVPAGGSESVSLGWNETTSVVTQSFSWTLGSDAGTIETQMEPTRFSDPDSCGDGCSVTGAPQPPWPWVPLMLVVARIRRRGVSSR